jgi:hypothetical protein
MKRQTHKILRSLSNLSNSGCHYILDNPVRKPSDIPSSDFAQLINFHNRSIQFLQGLISKDLTALVLEYLNQISPLRPVSAKKIWSPKCRRFLFEWYQWYMDGTYLSLYDLCLLIQQHFDPDRYKLEHKGYIRGISVHCCLLTCRKDSTKKREFRIVRNEPGQLGQQVPERILCCGSGKLSCCVYKLLVQSGPLRTESGNVIQRDVPRVLLIVREKQFVDWMHEILDLQTDSPQ